MTSDRSELSQERGLHLLVVLRLLQHLVLSPGRGNNADLVGRPQIIAELAADMNVFCNALELKRAVVFEALYDSYFDGLRLSQRAGHGVDGQEPTAKELTRTRAGLPDRHKE